MSILNILKKIKLLSFEDEFIQDPAEKAMDAAPSSHNSNVIYDPRKDSEKLSAREHLREGARDRHNIPGDPSYIPSVSEDW